MPRKAAAASGAASESAEPRRSSRIKDMPKPEAVVKKVAKPRVKKADKAEKTDKEEHKIGEDSAEKPKLSRGKKRKESEEPNGAQSEVEGVDSDKPPPSKKVCSFPL